MWDTVLNARYFRSQSFPIINTVPSHEIIFRTRYYDPVAHGVQVLGSGLYHECESLFKFSQTRVEDFWPNDNLNILAFRCSKMNLLVYILFIALPLKMIQFSLVIHNLAHSNTEVV